MTAPREVLELAARGVRLLPVHSVDKGRCTCGDGDCQSPGKHPIQRGWQEIATTDPKALDEWWDRYPWANAGALMGGGQVALDVDPRHGGKQGLASLEAGLGGLPQTWTTLTGGSGGHLHFRVDGDVPTKNLAPGVELRGAGCFVVVPPSLHVSGREYAWDPARAPGVLALAWLPSQLLPEQDPVALPPIRKPLSPRMQRLLREGEIAKRMYQSRSEVIQAVMTNAAANGWSIDDVLDAMLDPRNAAGEKVRDMAAGRGGFPRARRYVEHCFRKAEAYLKANRREISVVDIDAALAAARAEVDFGGGPRGNSRVRVLRAHLQTAKKAGSVSYTASQRQLAEEAGSDPKTIRRVNGFLDEQGLVHRLSRGVGRVASTWELGVLLLPPSISPPTCQLNGGQYVHSPDPLHSLGQDQWRRGAFGGAGWMTYIALPSAGAGRTAMELAEATRQPVATVRAHLRKLHRARRGADRVADHDGHRPRRWRRGRANPAAVVPARAMGLLRRQRTRYDAERAQYLRDWDRRRSSL